MNICKYDIYFIIVLLLIAYVYFNPMKSENFQSTGVTGYQADVEAIRNLSSIATQLTANNSLTMPGALNVTNNLSVTGNIKTNKIATNGLDPNNMPDTWTGGIRTFDLFGNGTIAAGTDDGKTIKASMNKYGDGYFSGNIRTNKIATNGLDPNNMPDGWGGGIRTFDLFANGTIAAGTDDGKTIKSYINKNGDGYFDGNLTIKSGIKAPNSIGAFLVDGNVGLFPILCSMPNMHLFGLGDRDDSYIVMPGYKIEVYTNYNFTNDSGQNNNIPLTIIDNTDGFTTKHASVYSGKMNTGSSCKLFYLGSEVRINGI